MYICIYIYVYMIYHIHIYIRAHIIYIFIYVYIYIHIYIYNDNNPILAPAERAVCRAERWYAGNISHILLLRKRKRTHFAFLFIPFSVFNRAYEYTYSDV